MKRPVLFLLLTINCGLFCFQLKAQDLFTISGTVSNNKGTPIEAATVFIDGSKKITATSKAGEFSFPGIAPGTYHLVVNMLGYSSVKLDVVVTDNAKALKITLSEKQIALKTVQIGDGSKEMLKLFVKYFLGESENAKSCKILNPEVLDFSSQRSVTEASSDEFLVIENSRLGYRIKYLLRSFKYNSANEVTIYDGECIFENMEGTEAKKLEWKANRKDAYEGSLMHYLRSLYKNQSRQEGFLTYPVENFTYPLELDPNPMSTDQIVEHVDSNFMTFAYKKRLYTLFDKKKAAQKPKYINKSETRYVEKMGSILQLDAPIDRQGGYANYKDILIQGFWGRKRIGDQLPLEYVPGGDI
ncbi:MAG: carboxypeptidase-like regulatory domain-containing protein [Bacteroidota bacterium]